LAQLLHQIAVTQTVPESVATDLPERDALLSLAQKIPAETLQLYYQIALLGRRDIGLAPDEFAGFSMSLLRMLAFSPNESMVQPATSVATKPAPAQKKTELTAPAAEEPAEIQTKQVEIAPIEHAIALTPGQSVAMASIAIAPVIDAPSSMESAHAPEIIRHQFNGNWRNLVDELKLGLARALAQHCELITYDENSISLSVPEMQKHLLLPNYQDKLGSAIEQHFDKKIKLQFSIGGSGNTPAKQISHEKAQAQAGAETAIEQDVFVQALIQDFDATIIPNSIKPI
jgi:DNA polymerase-3 subunit gamma/tau